MQRFSWAIRFLGASKFVNNLFLNTVPCGSPQWFNDGHCDDDNNHQDCFWDGNDCCGNNVDTTYCSVCECLNPNYTNLTTTTTTPYTGPSTTPGLPSGCGMLY